MSIYHYWGKAKPENSEEQGYHLLVYHCLDVAAAGDVLIQSNIKFRQKLSEKLKIPEEMFHQCIKFFFSLHDLGKFSESFQGLRPDIYKKINNLEASLKYSKRHDTMGFMIWKELLKSLKKGSLSLPVKYSLLESRGFEVFIKVVTGHHGKPPAEYQKMYLEDCMNDNDFKAVESFINEMISLFLPNHEDFEAYFKGKELASLLKSLSWSLAGLVVLCDWIGSDSFYFKYVDYEMPLSKYWSEFALPGAEKAVHNSGILAAKKSRYSGIKHLFDYVETLTPLQSFCHETEIKPEPQLWILEDVTGSGKTEAALTIAHRLMSENQGDGVFIGLPTMATSNAMYERMYECYRKLFDTDAFPSLILSHSARHLSEKFRQSIMSEHVRDMDYEKDEKTASAQCSAWLANHRKKAMLADVGIGTVDQALLGILPVRHQSLRLFGLLGKVLIIDEIHAYDKYMNTLIQTLLKFHAAAGGSAVLLSATLPRKMRLEFVRAFLSGLGKEQGKELNGDQYPLITRAYAGDVNEYHVGTRKEVERKVAVNMLHDEKNVYDLIADSAEKGQCVCWIRNTVSDAMSAYTTLKDVHKISENKLMLFHSRFILNDRIKIEEKVLNCFGEKSGNEDRAGKILIATQVVEQSLDLDFDVMVSDLAPIDLVIQRAGRLHRHIRDEEGKRKKDAEDERPEPVFYILGPEPVSDADKNWFKSFFQKGSFVYPHSGYLWRTAKILSESGCIKMPDDARKFIEGVYNENEAEVYPEALKEASMKAEGEERGKRDMGTFNSLNLNQGYSIKNDKWDEDTRFPTRLGENTITVYLAKYMDGELSPLAQGNYPWDLSSLRAYESALSNISKDISPEVKSKLEQLKEDEKALNKYSFVLPVFQAGDDEWIGHGMNRGGRPVKIIYSRKTGLLIEDE